MARSFTSVIVFCDTDVIHGLVGLQSGIHISFLQPEWNVEPDQHQPELQILHRLEALFSTLDATQVNDN